MIIAYFLVPESLSFIVLSHLSFKNFIPKHGFGPTNPCPIQYQLIQRIFHWMFMCAGIPSWTAYVTASITKPRWSKMTAQIFRTGDEPFVRWTLSDYCVIRCCTYQIPTFLPEFYYSGRACKMAEAGLSFITYAHCLTLHALLAQHYKSFHQITLAESTFVQSHTATDFTHNCYLLAP